MTKVNSILRLGANEYLLICNGKEPSSVSGVLATNIGDFSPEEYTLGRCTQCFSQGNCFGRLFPGGIHAWQMHSMFLAGQLFCHPPTIGEKLYED